MCVALFWFLFLTASPTDTGTGNPLALTLTQCHILSPIYLSPNSHIIILSISAIASGTVLTPPPPTPTPLVSEDACLSCGSPTTEPTSNKPHITTPASGPRYEVGRYRWYTPVGTSRSRYKIEKAHTNMRTKIWWWIWSTDMIHPLKSEDQDMKHTHPALSHLIRFSFYVVHIFDAWSFVNHCIS